MSQLKVRLDRKTLKRWAKNCGAKPKWWHGSEYIRSLCINKLNEHHKEEG